MKTKKILPGAFLLFILFISALLFAVTGCSRDSGGIAPETGAQDWNSADFSYGGAFDENGFWKGIRALDYVEMFDYGALSIPSGAHEVSDAEIESKMGEILTAYPVFDRAAADGDELNIDYVGSIDGTEFDGGSTGGAGTDVIIGVTSYIDDFLEQLIGHMPGETVNVEVTFPDDYHEESLRGKDALFVTVINHISADFSRDLNDEFIKNNLNSDYGWASVAEMKESVREDLHKAAVRTYIRQYFTDEVNIKSLPEALIEYQENLMMKFYQDYADSAGMPVDDFLSLYVGAANREEIIEINREYNLQEAEYCLVVQAIAEDAGISIGGGDLSGYFAENYGSDDYSSFEREYGLPYLKQTVLKARVLDYIAERAVLE